MFFFFCARQFVNVAVFFSLQFFNFPMTLFGGQRVSYFIYIPGSSLERTSKSLHQHWQLLGAITFFSFLKITFKYQLIVFFRIFSNKALDNRLALLKCYLFRFVVMVTQPNIITKELLAYLFSNTSFCSECCHLKITLATFFFLFFILFQKSEKYL